MYAHTQTQTHVHQPQPTLIPTVLPHLMYTSVPSILELFHKWICDAVAWDLEYISAKLSHPIIAGGG